MQHEFAYRCPHCGETIQVTDDVMGEVVDCPICDRPFKVNVPKAQAADSDRVSEGTPEIDRPDREEGALTTLHPAMFRARPLKYIGYWAIVIVGCAAVGLALWDYYLIQKMFQIAAGALLIIVGGFLLGKWYLETLYTTLIVTTKRTILRKGIIARNTSEVQHDDVRNIQVDQNMFERVVGVGDLAVSSAGQADLEIDVDGIPDPEHVAETIRDLQ